MIFDELRNSGGRPVQVPPMVEVVMDATGLNKTHNDALREISARVLSQLHQLAKRGRIQGIGRRVGVSRAIPPQ